jgi:hypothetical protein
MEDVELLETLEERLDLEDARTALAEVKEQGAIPGRRSRLIWGCRWRPLSTASSSPRGLIAISAPAPRKFNAGSDPGSTPWLAILVHEAPRS